MQDRTPRLLADMLAQTGSDGFADALAAALADLGAVQVMVFGYGADGPRCLLSRNFVAGGLGAQLAGDYLAAGWRDDPLATRALALPDGAREVWSLAQLRDRLDPAYLDRFYAGPGLADKRAVLLARGEMRLCVNLYWAAPPQVTDAMLCLLAEAIRLHVAAIVPIGHPVLNGLSARERGVCLGMLAGQKSEEIAADLGISATSVATYRKRAYAKLGINAKGALFALCRG